MRKNPEFWAPSSFALIVSLGACADVIGLGDFTYDGTSPEIFCKPGDSIECYSGPDGTAGIGVCVSGKQSCVADGSAFGPCIGEIKPAVEVCATSDIDEDCDGNAFCPAEHLWSKRFGAGTDDVGRGVAVDAAGNVFLVGGVSGVGVDVDGTVIPANGAADIFVASFDPSGKALWSKRLGSVAKDIESAYAVAVGPDGNPVITGIFAGTGASIVFDSLSIPSFGGSDVFVAKLGKTGDVLWAESFGGTGDDEGRSIAVDAQGNVLVTGFFELNVDFGNGATVASKGAEDVFVVKYSSDGIYQWSRTLGSPTTQIGESIAVGPAGDAFVAGTFEGSIGALAGADLSCSTDLLSEGVTDVFVIGLDPDGTCLMQKRLGDAKIQEAHGIAFDPSGGLVVTGIFASVIGLDGSSVTAQGGLDMFATRVTTKGKLSWINRFGDADPTDAFSQEGLAATVTQLGDILLTGSFRGDLGVGSDVLLNPLQGNDQIFVIKTNNAGVPLWSRGFGANGDDIGRAIVADIAGNVYTTGSFHTDIDFGGGKLDSAGNTDIFLVKLRP